MRAKDLLVEFIDNMGFYNPSMDKSMSSEYNDARRPRLTLRHLNKLRKASDTAQFDKTQHQMHLPSMYNSNTSNDEAL